MHAERVVVFAKAPAAGAIQTRLAPLRDVWYDVNRPEDVRFLSTHLETGDDRCPATRAVLAQILGAS